ncbi:MAG: MerR family transcriptional regulator [Paenibacillaceae bacterium]|nr:MerR family transcriptional regulator [Paenibacillaceae bacterium]
MLTAINKVSAAMNLTSRTLRYWEKAGLFTSIRDPGSGWRLYDEQALQCIRLTDLLRRLDVSIPDIGTIIATGSVDELCRVLQKQLNKLTRMDKDIKKRHETISGLIRSLNRHTAISLSSLEDLLVPLDLSRTKYDLSRSKEDVNMESMEVRNSQFRFVQKYPMRTAAFSCVGVEPEDEAMQMVLNWVEQNNLLGTMHLFGFNTEPYPSEHHPAYGFGFCASVPEGAAIPEPLYEWKLPGGIYAQLDVPEDTNPAIGWHKVRELLAEGEWEYDRARHPGLEEHVRKADLNGYRVSILVPVKKKGP